MKSKIHREIRRKTIHIITGILFVLVAFWFRDIDAVFWFTVISLVPFGLFHFVVRWFSHTAIGRLAKQSIEREDGHHTNGIGGLTYAGGIILLYLVFGFEPVIVLTSIVMFAFGDGFASIIGTRWGKHRLNMDGHTKTLEGFLGGLIVSTLVSLIFVDLITAFVASGVMMIVELVGIRVRGREIPDNLYLPLVAGTTLYLLQLFF